MTLVAAWTRSTQKGRELWLMSDSRLSGGKIWDFAPKILSLGRSDAVIAFAGDTAWAYPLMAQATSYVESFINLRERVLSLDEAAIRILDLFNESLNFISDTILDSGEPDCSFILAGYSTHKKEFIIHRILYQRNTRQFAFRPPRKLRGDLLAFIGDAEPRKAAVRHLHELSNKDGRRHESLGLDPAKAFFHVLSSGNFREIGGPPQLSKVFEHMNVTHFGVYWPHDQPPEQQMIYLRGRRLNKYEVLDHPWVFEPESGKLWWHDFSPGRKAQDYSNPANKDTEPRVYLSDIHD